MVRGAIHVRGAMGTRRALRWDRWAKQRDRPLQWGGMYSSCPRFQETKIKKLPRQTQEQFPRRNMVSRRMYTTYGATNPVRGNPSRHGSQRAALARREVCCCTCCLRVCK